MGEYFSTDTKTIDFNDTSLVTNQYNLGYVFTRLGKGVMQQTRSLRIDLSKFEINSENKRILNKTQDLEFEVLNLPLQNYSWKIHKLGKDFYSNKFGDGTMTASKIKEMFNDMEKSNMNKVVVYRLQFTGYSEQSGEIGYCLCYENSELIHYAYPFYNLEIEYPNLGMGMMIRAINYAKENSKKYIYLGSVNDSKSKYKLQFEGLEWFDTETKTWSEDFEKLKTIIS